MPAPNILFIFADQHRHDALGCAGNSIIETPNLDRLAASGVRYANAWCQSPICQPSRAALITASYPNKLNVMRNFGPDMDPARPTFMQQLQAAGYDTANIGKTHYYATGLVPPTGKERDLRSFADRVQAFGFDHCVEEFDRYVHAMDSVETAYTEYLRREGVFETYRNTLKSIWRLTPNHWDGTTSPLSKEQDLTSFLTREASNWIAQRSRQKPFFLQLSYVQPHVPLMGDPQWAAFYQHQRIPRGPRKAEASGVNLWDEYLLWCGKHANAHLLNDEYVLNGARQYYAMISLIDECIGNLLQQLEASGQLDNTLIVYSSDHGEMLGDHGLMAKFNFYRSSVQVPLIVRPPGGTTATVSDSLVELIDVGPTLLDFAGAEPLRGVDGQSLGCTLADGNRTSLFSEIQQQSRASDAPIFRSVRDERFRYTLETNSGVACELFDLQEDPDEQHNLLGSDSAQAAQSKASMDAIGKLTAALHERIPTSAAN